MTTQTRTRYAGLATQLTALVEQHLELEDEPLVLAIYYEPGRAEEPDDIFLFEVIENFGGNNVDPDGELFEVTYGGTLSFPMELGQRLHLILTSPSEFRAALKEHWPLAEEFREAVDAGRARVLHSTADGEELWGLVHA